MKRHYTRRLYFLGKCLNGLNGSADGQTALPSEIKSPRVCVCMYDRKVTAVHAF